MIVSISSVIIYCYMCIVNISAYELSIVLLRSGVLGSDHDA